MVDEETPEHRAQHIEESGLSPERFDTLRRLKKDVGFQACRKQAHGFQEVMFCEDMNYSYFVREAKTLAKQVGEGTPDPGYAAEKLRHVVELFQIVNRFNPNTAQLWNCIYRSLYEGKALPPEQCAPLVTIPE